MCTRTLPCDLLLADLNRAPSLSVPIVPLLTLLALLVLLAPGLLLLLLLLTLLALLVLLASGLLLLLLLLALLPLLILRDRVRTCAGHLAQAVERTMVALGDGHGDDFAEQTATATKRKENDRDGA